MTTTSSKGKRRSVSDATSPTDELGPNNGNSVLDAGSGNGSGSGRSAKRVRDDGEDTMDEKRPRGTKKGPKVVDESDMAVDADGGEDGEDGDTRCVCGKGDSDEGGLMVMCETCKVWQHTQCMDIPEDDVPEHYYCEQCAPDLHVELLKRLAKARRPRRRSSATRTIQKLSPSPSPPIPMTTAKAPNKRRNTMNSRNTIYEEEIALAIKASRMDNQDDEEEDDDAVPVVVVGPRKRRKRSAPASVPDQDSLPPAKRSRSASLTSEHPPPITEVTPNPDTLLDVPDLPAPEPSDEEANHIPPPLPTTRGKRGGGARKGMRKNVTPSLVDDNDDVPTMRVSGRGGRQPNQYSRRGGHAGAKRGGHHHATHDSNKRANNFNNAKVTRPTSPAPFFTSWQLPDYLTHLQNQLPSEIPEPLDIKKSSGPATTQERGVKVKWPTKRMTIGDMNKRVRNMLEYATREQAGHAERKARVEALEEAIASGKYKRVTPEMDNSNIMDLDALPTLMIEEDVKPDMDTEDQPVVEPRPSRAKPVEPIDNDTVQWMKKSTEDMLSDLVTDLLAFQDRYRPRNRRHLTVGAAA